MKKYVIDSNVIFSALISGKQIYLNLFDEFTFYIPDFVFLEIDKYKAVILSKTKLTKRELQNFIKRLFQQIIVIPSLYIEEKNRKKATDLCMDIDLKDTVYVALSIEMKLPLVTRDKPLYEGLKKKDFNQVILFDELMQQII